MLAFPQHVRMFSLAVEFGPYLCEDNYVLGLFRGLPFVGVFLGIFVSIFISDNKTRKGTIVLFNLITNLAYLILVSSQNIYFALVGQFLALFGSLPTLRTSMSIVADVTEPVLRQRFVSCLLAANAVGAIFGGAMYPLIGHWRLASLYIGLLPSLLLTLLLIAILKDSPRFILRNAENAEEAAEEFNKIGRINGVGQEMMYRAEELVEIIQREKEAMQIKNSISVLDLFRYDSLRIVSIFLSLSYTVNHICFLSYNAVIEHVGLTPVINSAVLYTSEIVAIPVIIAVVPFFSRLFLFHVSLGCAVLFSTAAYFVTVPE